MLTPTACLSTPSDPPASIAGRPAPAASRAVTGSSSFRRRRWRHRTATGRAGVAGRTTPSTGSPALERVRRACVAVARHPEAPWTATKVARAGGTTVVQIQRAFRSVLGLAPRDYVAACRRRRFLDHLRNGDGVTGAMYDAGYGSPSRLYGAIRLPGMQPATYGRGGARRLDRLDDDRHAAWSRARRRDLEGTVFRRGRDVGERAGVGR